MATTVRSPSPNPSRPRTPDAITRKGTTSILYSPSEPHHHRNAACKLASPRASVEHKENERDASNATSKPSASRARSPAPSSAKGAKNFMSPTISAASKAVAASPRRRILAEKNEPAVSVRYSLTSLPDDSPAPEEVPAKGELCFGPRWHQDSSAMDSCICSEPRKEEVEIKNHHHSDVLIPFPISPAAIAPLDADPSLPPYDPHTNYLSPRPRFLRYRPNPRIEHYLHNEDGSTDAGEGKQLEDSFTSESCEDTMEQTEEEQSCGSQKDCEEEDCEEESSSSQAELTEEDAGGSPVPEPESHPKSSGKGRSFPHYKFASLLLVLVIACAFGSFRGCPIMSASMLRPPVIPAMDHQHVRDYLTVSAVNLKEVARRLGHWSFDSFAYYTMLTTLPRGEFGPILLANITTSSVEQRAEIEYTYGETMLNNEQISQGSDMVQAFEGDREEESMEVYDVDVSGDEPEDGTVDEDEKSGMVVIQESEESDVVVEEKNAGSEFHEALQEDSPVEFENGKEIEEAKEMEAGERFDGFDSENNVDETEHEAVGSQDDSGSSSSGSQTEPSGLEDSFFASGEEHETPDDSSSSSSGSQTESSGIEDSPSASGDEYEISDDLKSQEFSIYGSDGKQSMKLAAGPFSLVLLAACIMFLLMKRNQRKQTPKLTLQPTKKVMSKSVSRSSESYDHARGSPFQNTPVDMLMSDSGPSEFSSSLRHSVSAGRRRATRKDEEEDETFSHETRMRRESTVSSSSMSYGSFTTYEKLSAKKGSRDEEVMTPVRRSSRIRSQIASP